jgi:hypothetical protein
VPSGDNKVMAKMSAGMKMRSGEHTIVIFCLSFFTLPPKAPEPLMPVDILAIDG